ncbi:MAG: dipeptide ABC transporter ATP-binding protein [Alphaproteobacteria bacterium]|jgi:peptide/nickel transport system ATP-binding protein|nr:dipeptide ABC transporter ATP-binding protein [Alphaproteobacteria bacterium]MBT4544482.1 dipeptide ABC transporter ATP-binding protein [Alphaproteobacteria bacterium]MBT7746257.1 dipeptide ABC transporter ATP-binding protein [Alphaproteobacteria bacterium]
MTEVPVVNAIDVVRHYTLPRESLFRPPAVVQALNGVSFSISRGRSLGVVGESGCGKSTLARCVMALEPLDGGKVEIEGAHLEGLDVNALRDKRRHFQMVFQDPFGSLDPRQKVARIVAEPLEALEKLGKAERLERVADVIASVGLKPADIDKFPHEFSGGQRQRIAIARALVTKPTLIVADEPVSALDVSVQAQVLNLLQDLQDQFGVTYLMISHDLAVVEYVCDEVAVMYLGSIVEHGPAAEVFANPVHPYTRALLEAVPQLVPGRKKRQRLSGNVQSPIDLPVGCAFADRCPQVEARCREARPVLEEVASGHKSACFLNN